MLVMIRMIKNDGNSNDNDNGNIDIILLIMINKAIVDG